MRVAAIVDRDGILGVEIDRLVEVLDGAIVLRARRIGVARLLSRIASGSILIAAS